MCIKQYIGIGGALAFAKENSETKQLNAVLRERKTHSNGKDGKISANSSREMYVQMEFKTV